MLQKIHPEDFVTFYIFYGVLAQLHAINNFDYDAEVEMEFYDQLVKDFPELVIPEIHTLDIPEEAPCKYAVYGAGEPVFEAVTLEEARKAIEDYEKEEKADELYVPDFYSIVDIETGLVVK
jgi:hypothetical protein